MSDSSFLQADGTLAPPRNRWLSEWLPSVEQVRQALQLRFDGTPAGAMAPYEGYHENTNPLAITMRQGLGLVVLAALVAGFLPFLVNSFTAISMGTPLPLIRLAQQAPSANGAPLSPIGHSLQTLAGLEPAFFPRWFAALLSTLGVWINWPLRGLTWWLVYGAATLLATKVWGAPPTLQRFLAATSYAAAPLVLAGLGPIPCLGVVAQLVAIAWMLVVYVAATRAITGLDWGRAIIAIILPAAFVALVGFALTLAFATSIAGMIFGGWGLN